MMFVLAFIVGLIAIPIIDLTVNRKHGKAYFEIKADPEMRVKYDYLLRENERFFEAQPRHLVSIGIGGSLLFLTLLDAFMGWVR